MTLATARGYRCYFLDVARHIKDSDTFDARDDDEAMRMGVERLRRRPEFSAIELWDNSRFVASINLTP
jgi:hypothetical protein